MDHNKEGPKTLISGPGSLDELLTGMAAVAMRTVNSYDPEKQPITILKSQRNFDAAKGKFAKIDDARAALALGDKEPGLAILDDQIERLREAIRFNEEQGTSDVASQQRTLLVALQMLKKDETGIEPKYFGLKSVKEEELDMPDIPEGVSRSDIFTGFLFKTLNSLASHKSAMSSYGSPSVTPGNLSHYVDELFNYPNSLTEEEMVLLKKYVTDIGVEITDFTSEHLKNGYDRSTTIESPKEAKPQELVRFRDSYNRDFTPYALMYMENGGEIKCRYGNMKNMAQVYNLDAGVEGIKMELVGKAEPLLVDLQEKIIGELTNEAFDNNWKQINPSSKLNYLIV